MYWLMVISKTKEKIISALLFFSKLKKKMYQSEIVFMQFNDKIMYSY